MVKKIQSTFKSFGSFAMAGVVALVLFAPENPNSRDKVVSHLEKNGFTAVRVEDASWCNNAPGMRRTFTAVNSQGQAVRGKVCSDQIETTPRKVFM